MAGAPTLKVATGARAWLKGAGHLPLAVSCSVREAGDAVLPPVPFTTYRAEDRRSGDEPGARARRQALVPGIERVYQVNAVTTHDYIHT